MPSGALLVPSRPFAPVLDSVLHWGVLVRGNLPSCSSPLTALPVASKLSSCYKIVSEAWNRKSLPSILKVNTFSLFHSYVLNLAIEAHPRGRLN